MKFELKTENEKYSNSFSNFFKTIFMVSLIIIFFDIALKLRIISRNYRMEYDCRLLSVEKSKSNFKKLSKSSNLKNKQRIWEFCKEVIN